VLFAITGAGRLVMDAALLRLFHLFPRLPDKMMLAAMGGYDGYVQLVYRGWLRVNVRDPATRRRLLPKYGIVGKRPVFSNAFLPAFNHPTTELITTPIERVVPSGVRTVDGTEYPTDLLVMATGYEMWTDPETYRSGTILGREGFDLAEDYHRNGLRSYAGTCHPELPNRWELVGPQGFQGFAWPDYVETMALHIVRVIDESRARGADVVSVTRSAFDRWNQKIARRAAAVNLYYRTRANRNLNTYYVNSHHEALYYRPQTITGTRRFARRSSMHDYEFTRAARVQTAKEVVPA
jgi:hypothetical protein